MKRIALLLLAAAGTAGASAQSQLALSGTSYTQNFNNLAGGLPTGWHVFNFATATSLGTIYDTSSKLFLVPSATTAWKSTAGGFKNFASANNTTMFYTLGADTTAQKAATDRALGVRQVGYTSATFPGSDSGAAFGLLIANTTGLTNFAMTFKLQSLDSATGPRKTTWRVDYGTGTSPSTFTMVGSTDTTGTSSYLNKTVSVSFGNALNNLTGPVWIRIAAISASTGSGNRTSSAIDDVNLTWSGSGTGTTSVSNVNSATLPITVVNPAANGNFILSCAVQQAAKLTAHVYDLNGREVAAQTFSAIKGENRLQLHTSLAAGTYIIRVDDGKEWGSVKATML